MAPMAVANELQFDVDTSVAHVTIRRRCSGATQGPKPVPRALVRLTPRSSSSMMRSIRVASANERSRRGSVAQ